MSVRTPCVDKATGWVVLDQYQIPKVDFPSAPYQAGTWLALVKKDAQKRKKTISLDQLEVAMGHLVLKITPTIIPIQNYSNNHQLAVDTVVGLHRR